MLLTYVDPFEGFHGFLAIDGGHHRLAAGGFRVQPDLTPERIEALARTMTCKQRLLGLGVDGAKSGIAYDPRSPGCGAAIGRFLQFIAPHLASRYAMGPDMGTTLSELDAIAASVGLPPVKSAIARAQGLDQEAFLKRLELLEVPVGGATLGERRAGQGVAAIVCRLLAEARVPPAAARVGVQGFGTLGRGTVLALAERGIPVVCLADASGSLHATGALGLATLLSRPRGRLLRDDAPPQGCSLGDATDILATELDVLVLAAVEDAADEHQAARLPTRAVVAAGNLALSRDAETRLHARGTLVIPDVVAGCAGSASMAALFGSSGTPTAEAILFAIHSRMDALVRRILTICRADGVTPRAAAEVIAASTGVPPGGLPYPGGTPADRWPTPMGACI